MICWDELTTIGLPWTTLSLAFTIRAGRACLDELSCSADFGDVQDPEIQRVELELGATNSSGSRYGARVSGMRFAKSILGGGI